MRPLALVLLATATLATPLAQMDSSVAGRRIGDHHQSRVDLQKGLYLFYDGNWDGAHDRLVLSDSLEAILLNSGISDPDSPRTKTEFRNRFLPARFTPATDSGVEIGMTKRQVRNIVGRPQRSFYSQKFKADEFVYTHTTKKTADGLADKYTNYYLFKKDRLYFIELRYDMIGGGW